LSSSPIINGVAILGSGTMGSGIAQVWALTQSVYRAIFEEPRYGPHPIQRRMVDANLLGRKTGRGFYDYSQKSTCSVSALNERC
jgi:3-hydroxyacyl-CoA dehydrogenase